MVDHQNRAHAKLSASGSKQWLSCTPSIKLSEPFPDTYSADAEQGTTAHELAENRLRWALDKTIPLMDGDREMLLYVTMYANYVLERYHAALAETLDAELLLEQRLDFSHIVPDGFGTGDAVIVADGLLEIIDLKYGMNRVEAIGNSQLQLYAIGAIEKYFNLYNFRTVRVTIVQPLLDSITSWDIDVDDLIAWGNEFVKPRAELAIKGEGEFVSGSHCRYCKARHICRKRAEDNLEMAKFEFSEPNLLTDSELNEILLRADELSKWVSDVKDYALNRLLNGMEIEGWELASGRSTRKIIEPDEAAKTLLQLGYQADQIYSTELIGIGGLEKLVGKKEFTSILGAYIERVEGKQTLKRRNGEK